MNLDTLHSLIHRYEGCRLMPYVDAAGVLTCGWGSTGVDVVPGRAWTQEYANQRMALDAVRFVRATQALCPKLEGDALCAIADFAYNLGIARLKASTLRRRLNARQYDAAAIELKKWVLGGGRKLPGLEHRRAEEAAILLDALHADR